MNIDAIMKSPRLKVERANTHIDSLISQSTPLSKDLYEFAVQRGRSVALLAKPDCFDLAYRPKKPIQEFFALIVGDVIHNLRTSLDHWAAALVSEITQTARDTRVYFPFAGECKDLETARGYAAIKKALPDAAEFIRDEIQPCRDGNNGADLWSITDLDNIDKHNFILPTVTVTTVDNINASDGSISLGDIAISGDAASPQGVFRSFRPITIDKNFETTVEITFPQGSLFENQPVIPVLLNLSEVTAKTLDSLERFLRT